MNHVWDDLSDDELRARLRERVGSVPKLRIDDVPHLVALRDEPEYAAMITEALES